MNCNRNKNNNCGNRISDNMFNLSQVGQQGPQGFPDQLDQKVSGEKQVQQAHKAKLVCKAFPGKKARKGIRATADCQSPQVMQISSIHRNKQSNSQQCREVFFLSTQLRFPKALN